MIASTIRCGLAFLLITSVARAFPQAPDTVADPMFKEPHVDIDEWRDKPLRHRYVHGEFRGTETRFSFYFPPAEQFEGRFFQHITPIPIDENLAQRGTGPSDFLRFSIDSGGVLAELSDQPAQQHGALAHPQRLPRLEGLSSKLPEKVRDALASAQAVIWRRGRN